ncbi:MAG TPA: DUF2971 domain-containing protein [Terriglobales bacterium]|jgi:hypothetical protein|nr:DUF2971 domain-containing protein [Terriglobales bacterium]
MWTTLNHGVKYFTKMSSMKKLTEYDQSAVELASSAFNKISKFNYERNLAELPQTPKTKLLYHYTTASGLQGIIERNELWATSAYFLNDPAEITYGCDRVKEVFDVWLNNEANTQSPDSLIACFVRDLRRVFGEILFNKQLIHPIYLACFCEEDNLLSQWRAYGQSGGYSLGFRAPNIDTPWLGDGFIPEPNTYTSRWTKVEYDKSEQTKHCNALLSPILSLFEDVATAKAIRTISDHPLLGYSAFLRLIQDMLLEEIVRFKHEAFQVEKEWRVVVRRRELKKQATDDGGKTPVKTHYRVSNGMVIPYIKLIPTPKEKHLPIKCIRTGPTLDKTTSAMALHMLLESNGYPHIPVVGSDIAVKL